MSRETINSAKLNRENHCLVYPLTNCGGYYIPEEGWKLVGESKAPYGRNGRDAAIVFEKTSPAKESIMDVLSDLEPGLYWCHGSLAELDIRER